MHAGLRILPRRCHLLSGPKGYDVITTADVDLCNHKSDRGAGAQAQAFAFLRHASQFGVISWPSRAPSTSSYDDVRASYADS